MKKCLILLLVLALCIPAAVTADSLPLDLTGGVPYTVKYSSELEVYEDPTIRVERHRVGSPREEFGCTYYYAIIDIKDPSQLRTYPADGKHFVSNSRFPAATMAKRVNAVLAINGDFTGAFSGNKSNTYVLRMGQVWRDTVESNLDMLLIDDLGDFHIVTRENDLEHMDKTTINGRPVINAFQFGPALIIDGEPVADEILTDYSRSPAYAEPDRLGQRMVLCQLDTLRYMVVCCAHYGASLPTMREIVRHIAPECKVAFTLDGGESTQMIFLGRKINNVKEGGKDRGITDIIYFASANKED